MTTTKISLESKGQFANPNFIFKSSQAITIPKSTRFKILTTPTPGPGSYNFISSSSSAITFPKTRRITIEKNPETPGPADYNIPKIIEGPKFSISNTRPRSKSPINPGPGQYEVPLTERPCSVIFPKSERKLIRVNSISPGPAHYTSKSKFFTQTCTFPKAPKTPDKKTTQVGPGCYEIISKSKFRFAFTKDRRKSPFE
ncbi:hypothetical protein SteCoe_30619 [Stentor coeruleus]|uniref:Uncharacterized protein n=1 Tax=Stentor coeruleus TaxID=5963 RepID=A0A1R2B388_9CILI|nr:hypothetical protein SteCoe_30619 [Stentor coeruleus]